ncbi:hypothetical protein E1218_28585 [Kribbella turkmenica]|uniref:Uncharacterized protein n=1 Tax=Kribbella turkmenica TaxID=2530375 RepID=A0A4R4WI44_9ACTN|nr:hypothetical protein [Kribbella turkmenica]TDD17097.1 hypothetical protein E1218_28585 [Kribbella turkmenica]
MAMYRHLDHIAAGAPESVIASARQYASEYGGLRFRVLGGVLEGDLWLAARRPRLSITRAPDGTYMYLAADHGDAQCALVISESGAFGSSWTREFGGLFDSVEHMLECVALWDQVEGWLYVTVFTGDPDKAVELADGLVADEASAGTTSRWWIGADSAVVVEPYLTAAARTTPQVTVLARTNHEAARLATLFSTLPPLNTGFAAAHLRATVGRSGGA